MALQTLTSTSSAPGESPTSNPPPPPPNNADPNPFSPAGSPPLILAFLAIGLFAGAMIVVFGFRRIQLARSFRLGGMPHEHGLGGESTTPLRKPQLWEVESAQDATWWQVSGRSLEKSTAYDGHWAMMMPLAAEAVSTELNPLPEESKPPPPQRILLSQPLGRTARGSHGVWPHWRPLPEIDVPHERHDSMDKPAGPVAKTLQVGVPIIMPSPQHPIYIRKRTDSGFYEGGGRSPTGRTEVQDIPDYAIGLYECSWD